MTDIQIAIGAALVSAFAGIAGVILQVIYSKKNERFKKHYDYQHLRFNELKKLKVKLIDLEKNTFGNQLDLLKLPNEDFKKKFADETIDKYYKTETLVDDYMFYFTSNKTKHFNEERKKLKIMHSEIKTLIMKNELKENDTSIKEFNQIFNKAISESAKYHTLFLELTNNEISNIKKYITKNAV